MFQLFLMFLYRHDSLFQICFCLFIGLRFWFSKIKPSVTLSPCVKKKHLIGSILAIFIEEHIILSTDDILLKLC